MMGSSYEERRLDSSICCLIDTGERCRRQAGRSSIPSGLHKVNQKRNLRLEIDKKMTHAYICSYHAEMISKKPSSGGKQRGSSNGSSHNGNSNASAGSLKWLQSSAVKSSSGGSKLRSGTSQSMHYDDISDPDDDSDSEIVGSGRKLVGRRDQQRSGGGGVQLQSVGVRHRDVGLRGGVLASSGGSKKVSLGGGGGSKTGGATAGSGGSSSASSGPMLALNLLEPKSIKKCRKYFKISLMHAGNKTQLIELLHQHIREMKISEKDVINRFIMKVNSRRNSRNDNDYH